MSSLYAKYKIHKGTFSVAVKIAISLSATTATKPLRQLRGATKLRSYVTFQLFCHN